MNLPFDSDEAMRKNDKLAYELDKTLKTYLKMFFDCKDLDLKNEDQLDKLFDHVFEDIDFYEQIKSCLDDICVSLEDLDEDELEDILRQ